MSRTTIIIALLLAALLGGAAIFALRPKTPSGTTGPLLAGFDISGVNRLEIGRGAGPSTSIELHDRAAGVWVMHWVDAGGVARTWPASASRVRAALRLLAELMSDPAAGSGPSDPKATRVTISTSGAAQRVLLLGEGAVAGRTRVTLEGSSPPAAALAESALLQVFQSEGIEAWREPSIFGTEVSDASRLTIGSGSREIVLARVGKSWGMQAPLVAPADEPTVTTVLNALASSAVRSFLARATPECDQALAGPASKIVVESTHRGGAGDADRWTVVQSVTIGGAADVGGSSLFARLEAMIEVPSTRTSAVIWGPALVTVDREAVNAIPADPAAFVSRVALRTPLAGVGALAFSIRTENQDTTWTATRTPGGWKAGEDPASTRTSAVLDAVLKLVTQERAGAVRLDEPEGLRVAARVDIISPDRAKVEECTLLVPTSQSAKHSLTVGSGGAWRTYSGQGVTAITEWLEAGAKARP